MTRGGAEWQKMAQIEENFLEIPALSIRQLTSSPSFCNATQLYNNDEKCHKMTHHATNLQYLLGIDGFSLLAI